MSTPSGALPETLRDSQAAAPTAMPAPRPLYWSLRRELWENHSLYIAPLAVAILGLCGFVVSLIWPPKDQTGLMGIDPAYHTVALAMPYSHAEMVLMLTGLIVGIFYCLDALHSERRDRSILFWKSLPVSDFTTVFAKSAIPLVVLPLLLFVIVAAMQLIMLLLSVAALLMTGGSAATLLRQLPLFQLQLVMLYSLAVSTLWYAPIYGWFLLVSSWARRATLLWAVLPPLAITAVEWIAFRTSHFGSLLVNRLFGFAPNAYVLTMPDGSAVDPHFIPVTQLAPGRFLASPGLWIGLAIAAAFLAAAVRLRRYREPI
jgi:ABC-2 type transport system permease protein